MRIFKYIIVILLSQLTPGYTALAASPIWQSEKTWNSLAELQFSHWLAALNADYLQQANIRTDCADAYLALRWIFARENGYPAANSLHNGKIFSHESTGSWSKLPTDPIWQKDERFLSALRYLLESTSSGTLFFDSYPVRLNHQSLAPGAYFIKRTEDLGHVDIVYRQDLTSLSIPLLIFASTVPIQARELIIYPFSRKLRPQYGSNGFMRMRWPQANADGSWALQAPTKMPDYSMEQYQLPDNQLAFDDLVFERLLGHKLSSQAKLTGLVMALIEKFQLRIVSVKAGEICRRSSCKKGSANFESYSTYARDTSLVFLIQDIDRLIYDQPNPLLRTQLQNQWYNYHQIEIGEIESQTLNLGELVNIWKAQSYNSDPNQSIENRWGLTPSLKLFK